MKRIIMLGLCITLILMAQIGLGRSAYAAEENRSVAEQLLPFSEGVAGINIGGKWGFIDTYGKQVIDPVYSKVRSYHEGHAAVRLEKKWGLIDKKNKYVINPRFEEGMRDLSEGLIAVKGQESWGYIDTSGKTVIAMRYDEAKEFHEGTAAVRTKQKWGYIDTKGSYIIEPRFSDAGSFKDGFAPVKLENNWGYIKKNGKIAIEPQFDTALEFREELAAVKIDGNWGFINSNGKFTINPQYSGLGNFSEKVAAFNRNGRWGYLSKNDKPLIPPDYVSATDFSSEGLALVENDNEFFYINSSGKRILNVSARKVMSSPLPDDTEFDFDATEPDMIIGLGKAPVSKTCPAFLHHYHAAFSHESKADAYQFDWMKNLYDSQTLNQLSIPGTHDSMSLFGGDIVETQSMPLLVQLDAGIRALDIRCRHINNAFAIHHGEKYQNANFDDVLSTVRNFLKSHPKDFVVMRVKEEYDSTGNTRSFDATFKTYYDSYGDLFWKPASLTDTQPKVENIRGKIVVLQDWNWDDDKKIFGIQWNRNGSNTLDIQDDYNISPTPEPFHKKWTEVREHLDKASGSSSQQTFVNFLSASHFWNKDDKKHGFLMGFPYLYASGKSSHGTNAPLRLTGWTTPGWKNSVQDFPRVCCKLGICSIAYLGTNILASDKLERENRRARVGIIYADFPGSALIKHVILRNTFK